MRENFAELHVPSSKVITIPFTLTTTPQVLYTGNSYRRPTLANIHLCNSHSGGGDTFSIHINNGTADFYVAFEEAIGSGNRTTIQGSELTFLAMEDGWTVNGVSNHDDHVDGFLTIIEAEGRRVS